MVITLGVKRIPLYILTHRALTKSCSQPSRKMTFVPFKTTAAGLVAANSAVRLVVSPLGNPPPSGDDTLFEETEYNLLVRKRRGRGGLRLEIDGQNAEEVGFLRGKNALWGRLNTGDRPGRIRLRVTLDDREALCAEIDVRPTKLDYETHFRAMRADLEAICRGLAYAPPRAARVGAQTGRGESTPLDFLQVAQVRLGRLCHTLRSILKHPDRRLVSHRTVRSVSLARGHDPASAAYLLRNPSVWTPLPDGPTRLVPLTSGNRRIGYTALEETDRHPSAHTPANRHLVAALDHLCCRARSIHRTLGQDTGPYPDLCRHIQTRLGRMLRSTPLRGVPPAAPSHPIPTHLDVRYTTAFALCRELMQALASCTGGPFDLAYRDTPTLYEYWTWFTLTRAFLHLGFSLAPNSADHLFRLSARGLTVRPLQGDASAIDLLAGDRRVRILYNPTYTVREGRSVTHDLRPDIVVEICHPDGRRQLHAFDAKYRREWHPEGEGGFWIPTREDIDKMHAYRDAVGQVSAEGFQRVLQHAVVLFPAPADPRYRTHRFYASLDHGIGGLPLLPGDPETVAQLRADLRNRLLSQHP